MPIRYHLRPLTDLLTVSFFPDLSPAELATKITLMTQAYLSYCLSYGLNCTSLTSPKTSVNSTQASAGNNFCDSTSQAVKLDHNHLIVVMNTLMAVSLAHLMMKCFMIERV